jgi:hypothetical protein
VVLVSFRLTQIPAPYFPSVRHVGWLIPPWPQKCSSRFMAPFGIQDAGSHIPLGVMLLPS